MIQILVPIPFETNVLNLSKLVCTNFFHGPLEISLTAGEGKVAMYRSPQTSLGQDIHGGVAVLVAFLFTTLNIICNLDCMEMEIDGTQEW